MAKNLWIALVLGCGCVGKFPTKALPCEDEACSGHGECRVTAGNVPECQCHPGFRAVGLSCVADCLAVTCGGRGACVVQNDEPMCDCDPGFLADGLSCVVNRTGQDGGNDGGSDADHGEGKPPDSGPDGGGHEQPDIGPDRGDDGGERDGQLVTDGGDADVSSPLDAETDGTVSPNGSMEWVHIPGGTFLMGSDLLEDSEQPVHLVTVPSFEIARTEVTVAQYGECVAERRCATPATGSYCNWDLPGAADHPVNCVSWLEAAQFCAWADSRLPSEAEWEYAARSAGQHIIFPWGNEMATCEYAIMVEGGEGCGTGRTFPVCSRTAGNTAQGLCDMAGNLWEWVQDWYHDGYDGAPTDGSAWDDSGSVRVARGGAFTHEAIALRTAARAYNGPTAQNFIVGLRCAR